ncbi:hypothetical protein ACNKHU_21225 [Shigella flexneri]
MGIHQQTTLLRHGFYPAGGGVVATEVSPVASLTPCNLASAEHYADAWRSSISWCAAPCC